MLTVRGQQHSFSTQERVFLCEVKVSKFLRQKMSRPEGDSNPQPPTGSGDIDIIEVKLTFEMLPVRGQQHSFSTHERVFL